jgi:hypothetical protein
MNPTKTKQRNEGSYGFFFFRKMYFLVANLARLEQLQTSGIPSEIPPK